jgi:hypothetical protein
MNFSLGLVSLNRWRSMPCPVSLGPSMLFKPP